MTSAPPALPRSFLYVPGNRPELFPKAAAGPADALILDLEDAVPVGAKAQARETVGDWMRGDAARPSPGSAGRQQWWVRLNGDDYAQDLHAVASAAVDGVFLAKCSRAAVEAAAGIIDGLEKEQKLPPGTGIIGLIEDAAALADLEQLVHSPRLVTLAIGEVDLMADLRMARTPATEPALDSLRTRVVVACAAAGLAAPVAPTSTAIRDTRLFEETGRKFLELGFRSRTAIHPSQLDIIHRTFTPDPAAVAAARELLDRFTGEGEGVVVDGNGRMIDAAVVRSARETLGRAPAEQP